MATYRGTTIKPGTDADVAAQVQRIDALPAGYTPQASVEAGNIGIQPLRVAKPNVPTAATGASTALSALRESWTTKTEAKLKEAQTKTTDSEDKMSALVERFGGLRSGKSALYESEGVNKLKKETDDILSQMESADLASTRRVEEIEKNLQGLSTRGLQSEVLKEQRENARHQADLGIVLTAKNRQFDTARGIIDDAVKAETEDLRFQLENTKYILEQNRADYSKTEERQYQMFTREEEQELEKMIREDERAYTEAKDTRTQIRSLQFEAAKNGAPQSVVAAIGRAEDYDRAIQAAGSFAGDVLDRKYKEMQIKKMQAEISAVESSTTQGGAADFSGINLTKPQDASTVLNGLLSNKKLPPAQRNQVAKGLAVLNKITDFYKKAPTGNFAGGPAAGLTQIFGTFAPNDVQTFKGDIGDLRQALITYITGAAYTSLQANDVNTYIPQMFRRDSTNATRINEVTNSILGDIESSLNASGMNIALPRASDFFSEENQRAALEEEVDSLTPEQREELRDEGLID